jgi:hypothetical protein
MCGCRGKSYYNFGWPQTFVVTIVTFGWTTNMWDCFVLNLLYHRHEAQTSVFSSQRLIMVHQEESHTSCRIENKSIPVVEPSL